MSAVAPSPLKKTRFLYDTVYEALKQRITDGTFRAGETLPEVQLAEMLAVSPRRYAARCGAWSPSSCWSR